MVSLKDITTIKLAEAIKSQQITSEQAVTYYLSNIKKYAHKNAVLEVFEDALLKAKEIDKKIKARESVGALAGVPFIIKDNMLCYGKKCTCASKFMEDFVSPYTATAVDRLLKQDAIVIARANMDEFAMGGSCEHSAFGACLNAVSDNHVSGGSSGGSAVAVALNMCSFALGSDTGGSIRQPASFNGVVGFKPSYGTVSRFGLVAFASSLDQIGPITKTVGDAEFVYSFLSGIDEHDQTTISLPINDSKISSLKGLKIGIIKQVLEIAQNTPNYSHFKKTIDVLKNCGANIQIIDMKEYDLALPAYYIIAPSEVASNLGRFDGIKYTKRAEQAKDIGSVYTLSRTEGFGEEVKRRIMLGNFCLSSGYYDAYYKNAKRVQKLLKNKFDEVFKSVDAIILPTTLGGAFKLNEKTEEPTSMWAEDMFTIFANLAELPAISIPNGKTAEGMPLGVQVACKKLDDLKLLKIASLIGGVLNV